MVDLDKLREEAKTKTVMFRSCWRCNPSHRYLKKVDYVIACIWCGNYYYKGVKITEE